MTVEASSPALIEKVRTASTDASGQYKIIELPPGVYTVAFGLTGFASVRREGIELTTGFTAPVNVEMRVGSIEETVTVSGQSPIVDTQNVRQQAVMSRDVIDAIPTGKTYGNLGALIPGVVLASAGGQQTQDVGGATGIAFTQLAIHGGRRFDQTLQINGMSVTNLDNESISTINFTDGNVQEIVMDVAAQSAESELGGVRVNIIPKDGGNTFRGSLAANFSTETSNPTTIRPTCRRVDCAHRTASSNCGTSPPGSAARSCGTSSGSTSPTARSARELRRRHVHQHDAGGLDAHLRPGTAGRRRPEDPRCEHPPDVAGERGTSSRSITTSIGAASAISSWRRRQAGGSSSRDLAESSRPGDLDHAGDAGCCSRGA